MPRAPIWSKHLNSAETLRDRATAPSEWAWLAEGEGALAPSRLAAAVLGRAYDACRAAGVFVESAAALGRWAGVDKSKVIKARGELLRLGLLKPCGIRLEDGRPVRDETGEGRVNNQCGYTVDSAAVEAARRRHRKAMRAAKGRCGDAPKTPGSTARGVTASQGHVTPSEQGVPEKSGAIKDLSGLKEEKEEKRAARAGLAALAASWIGGHREPDRELRAYESMLAMGYHPETIALAADNFADWIRRYHAGSTRMTLLHFLTADSCRKWLTTASAQRARRAARDARKGGGKKRKAREEAPREAFTLADVAFEWIAPGMWLGRTPGGYRAMVYPAGRGASAMDGELSAEELRACWARQYGEQGAWSRLRGAKSDRRAA